MSDQIIGNYRLQKEIYKSNQATVYRGKHKDLDNEVMIKMIPVPPQNQTTENLENIQRRFSQEAKAMGRLNHPNIIQVIDAGEVENYLYIVMDYVDGEHLDSFTDSNHLLPMVSVLEIGKQIATALNHAHRRFIVHRNVKPENIIYNAKTGMALLTEFGFARILDRTLTRTGTVLGSPSYMSPEQVRGQKLDHRTDTYSLGVSLYQLLAGGLPFAGSSLGELAGKIVYQEPQDIKDLQPDLPDYICDMVGTAMNKDRAMRYKTGKEMANAIKKCIKRLHKEAIS